MTSFVWGLIIGGAIGAFLIGMMAHRRPQWFANVVKAVNTVDDKINETIKK